MTLAPPSLPNPAASEPVQLAKAGRREFGLLAPLFLVLALVLGVGLLTEEVIEGDTARFDLTVITALRAPSDLAVPIGPLWLREAGRDVTALGSFTFLGFLFLVVIGYLLLRRQRGQALLMAAAVLGGTVLSNGLKYAVDRPRPDFPQSALVFTPGFPSGHATLGTIVFLTLAALLTRTTTEPRIKAYFVGLAVFLTVMVGLSRMYLGVHYPSDVVAGWCVGGAWALLCWTIAVRLQRRGEVEPPAAPPP
jgi:undecaprenyl-diphosphatase